MGEIQGKLPIWETSGELLAKHIRAIGELTFGTGTRCGRPVVLTLPVPCILLISRRCWLLGTM